MGDKYAPINVDCINPFLTAAVTVFRTMLSCELQRGTPYLGENVQPAHEISGIIGLSGKAVGTVVMSLDRDVALKAAETMLGEPQSEMNGDVADTVGELTNMIAGNAKAKLEQFEMTISLPSVIMGRHHSVFFPTNAQPINIPFESEWGNVCVQVGLCQKML
jgi:chemotaxis protein CheX